LGNIIQRIRLAWKTFKLEPFSISLDPYKIMSSDLVTDNCDFSHKYTGGRKAADHNQEPCNNDSKYCLSRLNVYLEVERHEHLHLCEEHSSKLLGMPISVYYGKTKVIT